MYEVEGKLVDYVEKFQDAEGTWRWAAKSNNGKSVASSGEGYENEQYCDLVISQLFPGAEVRNA